MIGKYYVKLEGFIKKYKNIISILSPTFAIYNYSKKNDDKLYNIKLANNTKKFFMAMSLFIIILISEYNLKSLFINNNPYVLKYTYIIMGFVLPYFILNKIVLKDYGMQGNYNCGKFKYIIPKIIYSKNIKIMFNMVIILYSVVLFFTDTFQNIGLVVQWILLILTIYIFGISRPIQFLLVFIRDILKKMYKKDERNVDGKLRLVILAIISFFNLVLDYAILFWSLNTLGNLILGVNMFDNNINNIIEMIYYTSGCGDFNPSNFIPMIFIIIKNISNFILITGNLALYINIESKDTGN